MVCVGCCCWFLREREEEERRRERERVSQFVFVVDGKPLSLSLSLSLLLFLCSSNIRSYTFENMENRRRETFSKFEEREREREREIYPSWIPRKHTKKRILYLENTHHRLISSIMKLNFIFTLLVLISVTLVQSYSPGTFFFVVSRFHLIRSGTILSVISHIRWEKSIWT